MSIRFKFRSCTNFDSVEIDGQPSISLWELRLKIARQKKLNIGVDIDLIFFDALSEQEYIDEHVQIASGSSVIVKRVPARTMPSTVKFQYQKLDSRGLNQSGWSYCCVSLGRVMRSNFPHKVLVELKCPLCNTFFKDAVMIPCCQYSFCDKCIHVALLEKEKCPKCTSSRYRVEDLLPNLSLRQAIAHLESQMVESEKGLRRHVPDGESGIQGKDFSCVIVVQREPEKEMPHSPSASGKGSNQVMEESFYDSLFREKSLSRTKSIDGGQGQYANHWDFPEYCQGESKPLNLLHSHVQEEGGNMNFLPTGRVEKDRNCYVCGSPDHLIRDCPLASNPNPMLQTGNHMIYPSPYWNNNTYSTLRPPLENMYANVGHAPFNASMVPSTPYVHPYMQSMHAGMPLHGEIMRMGSMALPEEGNRDDLPLNQHEYMGLQLAEDKRRIQYEKMGRGQYCQAESNFKEHFPKMDREVTGKLHKEKQPESSRKHLHVEKRKEKSRHCSSASRDKVTRHSDRSNDGFPSSSDRCRRESHLNHSRDSRKRGSHHNHHQEARSKERRGFGNDAKNSRHHARHSTDEVRDNKKRTSSGSYEDCRDGYHHKRKRAH